MKRAPLLNRHLSALVAKLGHLDEVVVADAGLPAPSSVPVIDLSITRDLPTLTQVLNVLRTELVIEQAVYAEESSTDLACGMARVLDAWAHEQGKPIDVRTLSHNVFKDRMRAARAVIRTGDFTPYSNVILTSGVPF